MANRRKSLISFITALVLGFLLALGWVNRWYIHDSIRLYGYQAPAEIAELASDTTMNSDSRRLFYVYSPSIEDKDEFNEHCKLSEFTIVLGCYVGGRGIYIYNVTDERLDGIKQVTAAHEMLHVAYERLGGSEKDRIDGLLQEALTSVANPRIQTTIEEYRKNGADISNELHSIIGTEVRTLTPELETYYSRYFENRSEVVRLSEQYEQAFTELKNRIAEADKTLEALRSQIDSLESEVEAMSKELQSRLAALNSASSAAEYNAAVPGYNRLVNVYNSKVRQLRKLIERYNALVAERNAIAIEENNLHKAIDSRPDTIETQ